jgi:hypothetical protein
VGGGAAAFWFITMSFSYVPGTSVFYIRSIIPDTLAPGIFSDEEITGFQQINQFTWQSSMYSSYQAGTLQLPATPSNIMRAAAIALNTLAGLGARNAVVTKLLDVQLGGAASSDALAKRAQFWLDMDDNSGAFAIYEQVNTVWAFRDRWLAMLQRQTGGGALS